MFFAKIIEFEWKTKYLSLFSQKLHNYLPINLISKSSASDVCLRTKISWLFIPHFPYSLFLHENNGWKIGNRIEKRAFVVFKASLRLSASEVSVERKRTFGQLVETNIQLVIPSKIVLLKQTFDVTNSLDLLKKLLPSYFFQSVTSAFFLYLLFVCFSFLFANLHLSLSVLRKDFWSLKNHLNVQNDSDER